MKLDKFLESFLAKTDFDAPPKSQASVIRVMKRGDATKSARATILFTPWQSGNVMQSWIMKQVPKKNAVYSISPKSLLLRDPVLTAKLCESVCEEATNFVRKELENNPNLKTVNIVGLSVGTGVAAYVTNQLYKDFKFSQVDLVCPGAELSTSLWLGSRTSRLKGYYEDDGHSLKEIQKMWSRVDLVNNLGFANHLPVRVSYSKADTVIVPEQTEEVIAKLGPMNSPALKIKKNHFLGHYATMFWVWLVWRLVYKSGKKL